MAQFAAAMAEVIAGRVRPWELDLRRKDDERVPVLVTPSVLRGDGGEIVSVTLMIKDLSERRAFEAALAESEELFRLAFDQAPVGAVLSDRSFCFTRVNDSFCRMLGYSEEELLAMSFPDVTHPDEVEVDFARSPASAGARSASTSGRSATSARTARPCGGGWSSGPS